VRLPPKPQSCKIPVCLRSTPEDSLDSRQGWTCSPDCRGTINIICNCWLTMFLCCWSALVVNTPDPGSKTCQILMRKLYLVVPCSIAPEIIFQVSLGQWPSAHHPVKLFYEVGRPDGNVRHGFYTDMGGFNLQPPDWKSFPMDAKQLHCLVVRSYVQYPDIRDSHIRDKNKVDKMLRLIDSSRRYDSSLMSLLVPPTALQSLSLTLALRPPSFSASPSLYAGCGSQRMCRDLTILGQTGRSQRYCWKQPSRPRECITTRH
jgi:hypothetical protein